MKAGKPWNDWKEDDNDTLTGYVPGPGKMVSCVDPDTDEEVGGPSLEPETVLAKEALETTRPGNPVFRDGREATAWYKLEVKYPRGWFESRFWCAEEYNWSYQTLVKGLQNPDTFRKWQRRQEK